MIILIITIIIMITMINIENSNNTIIHTWSPSTIHNELDGLSAPKGSSDRLPA